MHLHIDCIPCLVGQVIKAVRLTYPDTPEEKIKAIMDDVMRFLQAPDILQTHAPVVGQYVYQNVNKYLETDDAYRALKDAQNQQAQEYLPAIHHFLDHAREKGLDPLRAIVMVSITGNIIDLGAPTKIDIEDEIERLSHRDLDWDDFDLLKQDLNAAKTVLLIADNAGEIVFDKVFVEYLLDYFRDQQGTLEKVIVAVRGGAVINDATMEDAHAIHLTDTCEVVESTHSPGVILDQATPDFLGLYRTADVVIAKGQGNFEALSDADIRTELGKPTYFFLKCKCHVIEEMLGVPVGGLILKKRGSS